MDAQRNFGDLISNSMLTDLENKFLMNISEKNTKWARSKQIWAGLPGRRPTLPRRAWEGGSNLLAGRPGVSAVREAEPVRAKTIRPIRSRSTAGGHLLPRAQLAGAETLTGAGRSRGLT
jgi:hypothetical protein